MPTTVSGLTFYEEQAETGMYLGLTQFIDGFNDSSGGAIQLMAGARKGYRPVTTFVDDAALVQRRDPTSTGNLTPTTFSNTEHKTAKFFLATKHIFRRQDFIDQGFNTPDGALWIGEQLGLKYAQTLLNAALAACVGAINAIGTTAVLDITGGSPGTLAFTQVNLGLAKLGDMRQNARALVMPGAPLTSLVGDALATQAIAFQIGQTTVYNGLVPAMGLKTVVTDAPGLIVPATTSPVAPEKYYTLGLVPGAVKVKTGAASTPSLHFVTGSASAAPANETYLFSTESEVEIEVRGVSFTAVSNFPNDATLATSGSWTLVAADRKLGPGFLIYSK